MMVPRPRREKAWTAVVAGVMDVAGQGSAAMRLTILGAGAVGPGAAALAVSRGHQAVLWSPSGAGTAGMTGELDCEGVLEGRFAVRVAAALEDALVGADAVLLAVPAYAFVALLPRIAAALPADVPLLIAPAASLAPLVFEAARRGPRAPVGALATTPLGGRRLAPGRVRVAMIRSELEVAALPATAAPAMAALAHDLFGNRYLPAPDVLQVALINANPIIHAALALTNLTRIEQREAWPQYGMMTEGACRLMAALDTERDALARAWGLAIPSIATALHRASQVPVGPLAAMGRAIAAGRGAVLGPVALTSRYITEDVPFGLSFYLALAAARGTAMPVTQSVVTALEACCGQDFSHNPLLGGIDWTGLPAALVNGMHR
ncbi:MAG: NAD/NADP octopine/nopaline dehydrogenase family protein [Rubritepida sp.]|nr:NAD/NADP octopine/nopaline dehydrogenase family protein [Rubritepida sp.]